RRGSVPRACGGHVPAHTRNPSDAGGEDPRHAVSRILPLPPGLSGPPSQSLTRPASALSCPCRPRVRGGYRVVQRRLNASQGGDGPRLPWGMGQGRRPRIPTQCRVETAAGLKGEPAMAKDPVCGMNVDEKTAAATVVHKGTTYYFCSANCKTKFEKTPPLYV